MSGICERGHGYYPGQRCPDCPTSTTGDFGAVPDSVPFGDSVTLIKRLGDRAWQFDNTEGEESTARMLREAANRLAVLERELTDSRHFGETQAGLHDFFAEECERLELRESDRQSSECVCAETSTRNCPVHGQGLESASALEVEAERLRLALHEAVSWAQRPSPIPIVPFNEFLDRMGKLGAGPRALVVPGGGPLIASATKPEASPSPENEQKEIGDEQGSSSVEEVDRG